MMAFQFYCPQGHLLEGEPSQAGLPCQCPLCGETFSIPSAVAAEAAAAIGGDFALPEFPVPPATTPSMAPPGACRVQEVPLAPFQVPPPTAPLSPLGTGRVQEVPLAPFKAPPPTSAPLPPAATAPMQPPSPASAIPATARPRFELPPSQPPMAVATPLPAMAGFGAPPPQSPSPAMSPLPPAVVPPPGPTAPTVSAFELPPAQTLLLQSPAESTPALAPGGIALPFDPRAKDSLPFDLPDLPGGAGGLSFDLAPLETPALELPGEAAPVGGTMPTAAAWPEPGIDQTLLAGEAAPAEALGAPAEAIPAPLAFDVEEEKPKTIQILCPSGHPLETPRELLGNYAQCPICQEKFKLRYEDSVEYKRRKIAQMERRDEKMGQLWLIWAIVAAVVVGGGIILMLMFLPGR
ncbi:MAG: hypothetical protein ABSG68_19710 [Thermoguttaceae bacterium]|jgi:hypothetical protein